MVLKKFSLNSPVLIPYYHPSLPSLRAANNLPFSPWHILPGWYLGSWKAVVISRVSRLYSLIDWQSQQLTASFSLLFIFTGRMYTSWSHKHFTPLSFSILQMWGWKCETLEKLRQMFYPKEQLHLMTSQRISCMSIFVDQCRVLRGVGDELVDSVN